MSTNTPDTTTSPKTNSQVLQWAWGKYLGFFQMAEVEKERYELVTRLILILGLIQVLAAFVGTVWPLWFQTSQPMLLWNHRLPTDLVAFLMTTALGALVLYKPGKHWSLARSGANEIRHLIRLFRLGFIKDPQVLIRRIDTVISKMRSLGLNQSCPEWDGKKLPSKAVNKSDDDGLKFLSVDLLMQQVKNKFQTHQENSEEKRKYQQYLLIALILLNALGALFTWFEGTSFVLLTSYLAVIAERHFARQRWTDQSQHHAMAADDLDVLIAEWANRGNEILATPSKLKAFQGRVLTIWIEEERACAALMAPLIRFGDEKDSSPEKVEAADSLTK